jgi:hypothetical protein
MSDEYDNLFIDSAKDKESVIELAKHVNYDVCKETLEDEYFNYELENLLKNCSIDKALGVNANLLKHFLIKELYRIDKCVKIVPEKG